LIRAGAEFKNAVDSTAFSHSSFTGSRATYRHQFASRQRASSPFPSDGISMRCFMKYVTRLVLAVAFACAGASLASAQGRPGGGFTGGGFGGNAYSMIGTNKVLQEEIKVTDAQKTKLEDALKPIAAKRTELLGGAAGGQRRPGGNAGGQRPMLTEEQRKERDEKLAKLNDETKKAIEGVLDEKQAKRLGQINVQLLGFAAYSNKDVQEKLKLDDGQKDKIKAVAEEYTKDSAELRRDAPRAGFGGGRPGGQQPSDEDKKKIEEYNRKRDGLRKEAEDKVVAVLNADQKNTWKELVGEKVDTAKIQAAAFARPMQRRDN
jgi:Spy/CpxP family protein refolding chaperone